MKTTTNTDKNKKLSKKMREEIVDAIYTMSAL